MLFISEIKKKISKAEVCSSSSTSTVQVLITNSGSTGRLMPNAIDGLPAVMATIWIPEIKVKTPKEKRNLADIEDR